MSTEYIKDLLDKIKSLETQVAHWRQEYKTLEKASAVVVKQRDKALAENKDLGAPLADVYLIE